MARRIALATGILVFWSPPVAAVVGGKVANGLVLLTPIAVVATIVWIRAVAIVLPVDGPGRPSQGVKSTAYISGAMMMGWTALSVGAVGINVKTLLVTFIGWSLIVALAPFAVWWYNRTRAVAEAGKAPNRRISEWLKGKPPG